LRLATVSVSMAATLSGTKAALGCAAASSVGPPEPALIPQAVDISGDI
jgi:hypothetical protein